MKIKLDDAALVVDLGGAEIPVFRQVRRAIDEELTKRELNPLDPALLDQVSLDRYAMRLADKLIKEVGDDMTGFATDMRGEPVELSQEWIDEIVDEHWPQIWEEESSTRKPLRDRVYDR